MSKDTRCEEGKHDFVGVKILKYSVLACERCGLVKANDGKENPSRGTWNINANQSLSKGDV